jgi:hypothetical protein
LTERSKRQIYGEVGNKLVKRSMSNNIFKIYLLLLPFANLCLALLLSANLYFYFCSHLLLSVKLFFQFGSRLLLSANLYFHFENHLLLSVKLFFHFGSCLLLSANLYFYFGSRLLLSGDIQCKGFCDVHVFETPKMYHFLFTRHIVNMSLKASDVFKAIRSHYGNNIQYDDTGGEQYESHLDLSDGYDFIIEDGHDNNLYQVDGTAESADLNDDQTLLKQCDIILRCYQIR